MYTRLIEYWFERPRVLGVAVALLWIGSLPAAALAESVGHDLYITYCAACHGLEARGDGPVADALVIRPPDLTRLTRRLGLPVPRDRVAEYIDGRLDVRAHGSREMPVWGERFQDDLLGVPPTEDNTQRAIDAIVDYLLSIQQVRGAAR